MKTVPDLFQDYVAFQDRKLGVTNLQATFAVVEGPIREPVVAPAGNRAGSPLGRGFTAGQWSSSLSTRSRSAALVVLYSDTNQAPAEVGVTIATWDTNCRCSVLTVGPGSCE